MMGPGRVLAGRYVLEQPLGKGGMGEVWCARHQALDKLVAVKLMTPEAQAIDVLRARFEREAKACAALRSRHVVQVFDYGVEEGMPYLVMELLEGEDLTAPTAQPRRPLRTVATIVSQVAKGLMEAHQAGIVHRDIKLSNIFIARESGERVVKILDFGIAKALEAPGPKMTGTDVTLGSPSYMSPEQLLSKPIDGRSDLWSLAVVAFRLLTAVPPFHGDGPLDVAQKIVAGKRPRVADLVDGLPPAIDAFFDRALAVPRADRFASAEELAGELARIAAAHPDAVARDRGPPPAEPDADPTHAQPRPSLDDFAGDAARTRVQPPAAGSTPAPEVVRAAATTARLPPDAAASYRKTTPLVDRSSLPWANADAAMSASGPRPPEAPTPTGFGPPAPSSREGVGGGRATSLVVVSVIGACLSALLAWWVLGTRDGAPPQPAASTAAVAAAPPTSTPAPTGPRVEPLASSEVDTPPSSSAALPSPSASTSSGPAVAASSTRAPPRSGPAAPPRKGPRREILDTAR